MWLSVDETDRRPIYLQIVNQVKKQVYRGTLRAGDELPSVRELARMLGVNMHTVRTAYLRLQEQKVVTLRLGRRAIIARLPEVKDDSETKRELQLRIDELLTDAMLAGLSPDDIRRAVDQQLKHNEETKG